MAKWRSAKAATYGQQHTSNYFRLKQHRTDTKNYSSDKLEEINREIQLEKEGKPIDAPLYDFFMSPYDHGDNLQRISETTKDVLEKTITRIADR